MVVLTSRWPRSSWTVRIVSVVLEEVGGERMTERVRRGALRDTGALDCLLDRALQHGLVEVMPAALSSLSIDVYPGGREHPLSGPLPPRVGVLAGKSPR
jgi:hypothetical protein